MTNLIHIKMNIKEITDKSLDFTGKRVSEVFGITLTITAALLLASLLSYSPEDPNFIFQNNTKLKIYWVSMEAMFQIFFYKLLA